MTKVLRLAAALLVAAAFQGGTVAMAAGNATAPIVGTWLTPEKSEITVSPCSEDFCGNLTKIVVPPEEYAKLTDAEKKAVDAMDPSQFPDARNKDPNLRNRTLLGLQLMTLHPSGKPSEYDGSMYNPQDGNTYDGYMVVVDADTIKVGGCVLRVLCRDQEWKRAPTPPEATVGSAPAAKGQGSTVSASTFQ
ncbi:MAG: DUF2147 domain-containing protein [Devosia sp.]|jgi:uncharacterized protein (DUF2147 family)|nr:DUF2147 domain-containing protein [Devosiaceae bacterium]